METTTEYAVHAADRCAAMEVAGAALREQGHRVSRIAGTPDADPASASAGSFVAESGSRLLTVLLGALVRPGHEYRRYEVFVSTDGTQSAVTIQHADHGTAVAGGPIGAARRRASWREVTDVVERALRRAGLLVGRTDRLSR